MSDIELVVKIPRSIYANLSKIKQGSIASKRILECVRNGAPLPRDHGDLLDRKKIPSIRIRGITEFCNGYNKRSDEVDMDIVNAIVLIGER